MCAFAGSVISLFTRSQSGQVFGQLPQSIASMAHPVLGLSVHFCERAAGLREIEHRIESESAHATRLVRDMTCTFT